MAKPLVDVFTVEIPGCEYPPLRVAFDNGVVVDYIPVPKVKYCYPKPIGIFNRRVGYQYDPEYKLHHQWLKDNGKAIFLLLPKLPVALLDSIFFHVD